MLIARLCQRGVKVSDSVYLIVIFVSGCAIAYFDARAGWYAFVLHGIPSALIVTAVAMLERRFVGIKLGLATLLGDGSYSLYLFHPFVVSAIAKQLGKPQITCSETPLEHGYRCHYQG